jgi:hypothetical protein
LLRAAKPAGYVQISSFRNTQIQTPAQIPGFFPLLPLLRSLLDCWLLSADCGSKTNYDQKRKTIKAHNFWKFRFDLTRPQTVCTMKTVSILVLAALIGAAAGQPLALAPATAKLAINFRIPPATDQAKLEACVCAAITSTTGKPCGFDARRLEEDEEDLQGEVEGEMELERELQGGSCPNCNPGPSGYWCRLMHCRRRGLQGSAVASATAMTSSIQSKAAQCLALSVSSVVVTTTQAVAP